MCSDAGLRHTLIPPKELSSAAALDLLLILFTFTLLHHCKLFGRRHHGDHIRHKKGVCSNREKQQPCFFYCTRMIMMDLVRLLPRSCWQVMVCALSQMTGFLLVSGGPKSSLSSLLVPLAFWESSGSSLLFLSLFLMGEYMLSGDLGFRGTASLLKTLQFSLGWVLLRPAVI